jgi:hypothetical protein
MRDISVGDTKYKMWIRPLQQKASPTSPSQATKALTISTQKQEPVAMARLLVQPLHGLSPPPPQQQQQKQQQQKHLEIETRQVDQPMIQQQSATIPGQPPILTASDSRTNSPSPSPVSLKDFVFLKIIGQGSSGQVLLVRQLKTNRVLAMKKMSKSHLLKKNKIHQVKLERDVMAQAHNPVSINTFLFL